MSALWAITCYFNPIGYERRLRNYHEFRRRLAVPLATVELVYGARPELRTEDADVLLQLRGSDVLWQKEHLLNLALRSVPPECSRVVWLDCDLVFDRDDWPERLLRLLDTVPLAQVFSHLHEVRLEQLESCGIRGQAGTPSL